ncbi:tryptophan synthase subunit alpha [Acidiferrobacter sp.]|uniref:tryptophan synthase subunit alpha n=1 Tax=Acidiferrobacter sp. TaxID=1872107 RepID=UPI00262C9593|nr:tryptophan synthase subunit alpha [Acidiferrobacter sp.]
MSRIKDTFAALAGTRAALIPFITGGDPTLSATVPLMHALVRAGADLIEVGMPFSDPMADGPAIQMAHQRALAAGATTRAIIDLVAAFRRDDTRTPVILMGYVNPVEVMGYGVFARACQTAGVDGVLLVDMPPEEAVEWRAEASRAGLDTIFLLSPTTSVERLAVIGAASTGFLYYVALKGVTGASHLNVAEVAARLAIVRKSAALPVGVGFGIRDARSAAEVGRFADAVIVGSAIVEKMAAGTSTEAAIAGTEAFVRDLRAALVRGGGARS